MGNICWSIKPTKDWQCVWQLDQTLTRSISLSKHKNDTGGPRRWQAPVGTRHTWPPGAVLQSPFGLSWATSSCRAIHPVCGSTAITHCQTTAKHWKEDVWWQESSTGCVGLPGPSLSAHHRYTNMAWCPAVWTALLNRVGIFMCFTSDLHSITLIIGAKFPSRSEASSLRITWVFLYASLWNKSH